MGWLSERSSPLGTIGIIPGVLDWKMVTKEMYDKDQMSNYSHVLAKTKGEQQKVWVESPFPHVSIEA